MLVPFTQANRLEFARICANSRHLEKVIISRYLMRIDLAGREMAGFFFSSGRVRVKKLILLAFAMSFMDGAWAQSTVEATVEPTVAKREILKVADLLASPEIAWSYKPQILEALSRNDLDLSMDHAVEWLKANTWQPGRPPANLKEAKEQEKVKANSRGTNTTIAGFYARVDRAKVLLSRLRNYNFTDPKEFHSALTELITIGRSHVVFGFEGVIAWEMRKIFPSCEIPLKGE
jgi:hypothetical protein